MENKRLDWDVIWSAAGVIVTLGTLIFGCFISIKNEMKSIEKDMAIIKTVLVMKEVMPKELACNEEKK